MRFKLRSLMTLFTLVAAVIGYWAASAKQQRDAVDWVKSHGGSAYYPYSNPNVQFEPSLPSWLIQSLGNDFFYPIKRVEFRHQPVDDLSALTTLSQLVYCGIDDGLLTDATELYHLTKLMVLVIPRNPIRQLDGIQNLHSLRLLDASNTKVVDLQPLGRIAALNCLFLRGTPVHDISPLACNQQLQHLDISETGVTDLSPLKLCTSLEMLNVSGTTVSDEQVASLQTALPSCEIKR